MGDVVSSSSLSDGELAEIERIRLAYVVDRQERDEFARERLAVARFFDHDSGLLAVLSAGERGEPSSSSICRYCHRRRQSWAGTRLDGHAQCVVSAEFKMFVGRQMRAHHRLTYTAVSQAIGVTPSVLRAWYGWYSDRHGGTWPPTRWEVAARGE